MIDLTFELTFTLKLAVVVAINAKRDSLAACLKHGLALDAACIARDIVRFERLAASVYGFAFPSE
jgi:hypothetical protein